MIYENYTVGLRLDKPILQIFSIRSLVALGIFVVAAIVLRYLRVGRDIRAIGGDRRAARVAGVPVDRLLVGVFVISALGAALPGALLSYSLATASPTNIGFDVLTFSATAALIGGVRLSGGKGGAIGIAAGVLSLSVLQEILAILRSPDYVSSLITGGLLVLFTIVWAPDLVAVVPDDARRRRGRGARVTDAHQIRLDPDPLEPYLLSQGFRVGDLVIVSGQAALDEHGNIVGAGDFDAQAEQVFRNLARVLEAGGSSLERVVKVTIFLTDMANFGKIVELRQALVHAALPGRHDRRGERARASRARDRDRSHRSRALTDQRPLPAEPHSPNGSPRNGYLPTVDRLASPLIVWACGLLSSGRPRSKGHGSISLGLPRSEDDGAFRPAACSAAVGPRDAAPTRPAGAGRTSTKERVVR